MKLRPDPSLRRLGLFDIETLVREPNRVGDRRTGWTRHRAERRRDRDVGDGEIRERGPDPEERLRAAKFPRPR